MLDQQGQRRGGRGLKGRIGLVKHCEEIDRHDASCQERGKGREDVMRRLILIERQDELLPRDTQTRRELDVDSRKRGAHGSL
eukprot:evm.model.NODE_30167_length_28942_cov_29.149334.4